MASVNRHIEGDANVILVEVLSGVTVETGDLMFLDNSDDLRNDGSSIANNYGYPLKYLRISGSSLELNKVQVKSRFLGVSMDDKDGIDNANNLKIPIATSGKFKFDMKPSKTVKVGDMFAPSGTTSASDMYNQKIAKTTDSTKALGYFAECKTHATTVEVFIKPAFGVSKQI